MKQEVTPKNVSVIIHGWGITPGKEEPSSTVKMAAVVQFKEGSDCKSADIYLDPQELIPCLKEGDEKFMNFSDFGKWSFGPHVENK